VTRAIKSAIGRSAHSGGSDAAGTGRGERRPPAKPAPLPVVLAAGADFNALFDTSDEALVIVNSAGKLQRASARARRLLRLREGSVRRAELGEFVEPSSRGSGARFCTQLFSGARVESLDAVLPTGLPARFTLRAVLPVSGDLLLCVEPGRAEAAAAGAAELAAPAPWLPLEGKLLQTEKMAALGHLVSGIAHELNNPLTAIMGYAQLLLGHGLAPAQRAEADKVYQEAERARRIVKNLLFFARETRTERTRVDVNEIIERTLALRSYELRVENIAVEMALDLALPPTMADPYQLQQVVLNLLVNAEQALLEDRGRGRITLQTRQASGPRGPRLLLEVSDDGPGIPAAHASRLFDPFFTTKAPGVGTGLGLSIVYGIVQQHGGEVAFENLAEGGVKFTVDLPVVAPPSRVETASAPSAARAGGFRMGRILIVEDEPTVAQLIVDVLAEEGHHAEAVLDSQEGLARLARHHFDLVICDLRMPRLDGPAFYDALVRSGSPASGKILFITGDTLGRRTVEFLEPNAFPYLAKPFLVEELKLSVNRLLSAAPEAAQEAEPRTGRRAGPKTGLEN